MKNFNFFKKLAVVAIFFSVSVANLSAQEKEQSLLGKLVAYLDDNSNSMDESKLAKLTSLIEQTVRFKAPIVDEDARPMLLSYAENANEMNDYLSNEAKLNALSSEIEENIRFKAPSLTEEVNTNTEGLGENINKSSITINSASDFRAWLKENLEITLSREYSSLDGEMLVKISVADNGKLKNVRVFNSTDSDVAKLVVDVIKNSPEWVPAQLNGQNVEQQYYLPIKYLVR